MNIKINKELSAILAVGAVFAFSFAATGCDTQKYVKRVGAAPSVIESSVAVTTTRPSITETTKAPTVFEDITVTTTTVTKQTEDTEPEEKPTAKPTKKPTAKPTKKPTAKPTNKPTAKPTNKPAAKTTKKTTAKPTNKPTAKPTNKPAVETAKKPTNKPTAKPTNKPALSAAKKPTNTPTNTPTAVPTNTPVAVPTNTPSPKTEAKQLTKTGNNSDDTSKKIAGKYNGCNSVATVDATDLDKVKTTITVFDQENSPSKTVWVMEGKFDSATGVINYSQLIKTIDRYEDGEFVSRLEYHRKSQGKITIKSGKLTWKDGGESIADNMTFIDAKTHDHGPA